MLKNHLDKYLNQQYAEEFQTPDSPAPTTPPPILPAHPPGPVGQERHQRRQHRPNENWVVPLVVERAPVPPPASPPPAAPSPPPRHRPARPPHRHGPARRRSPPPLCCSFCYSPVAQWAAEHGVPVPSKDDHGPWSDHPLMGGDGAVTCPVLRRVVCGHCGATGDHAHTTRFHQLHWAEFN